MKTQAEQDAQKILKELDADSKSRELTGWRLYVYRVLLVAFAVYVIVSALLMNGQTLHTKLPLFVGLTLFIGYLKFPACKKHALRVNYIPWYDLVLAILSLAVYLYYPIMQGKVISTGGIIGWDLIVIGIIGILLLAEVCRRAVGIPLLVVVGAFVAYTVYVLYTRNPSTVPMRLIWDLFYNLDNGVFASPIAVCSGFIVIFIVFGSFLEKTGIGTFFVDLANSIAGSSAGGPAKVAVISSALEGMYSGSSVANTVGSGAVTIPTMKRTGYKPEFAAAVEAAASTGGQIMPPIMGAAAFLMAEITGLPYATIVIAAILPAVLYFAGIFMMVHFEAKRLGLKGLPKETLPNFFKLILKKGYLLTPIVVLVICMDSFTPAMSASHAILFAMAISLMDENFVDDLISRDKQKIKTALRGILLMAIPLVAYFVMAIFLETGPALFCGIAVAVVCSAFSKHAPLTPQKVFEGFEGGANSTIGVAVACGMAGIISGCVATTGLGSLLIAWIVPLAGSSTLLALFLTMLCCIVLGMGVPTTANYVIMSTITAPILINMGIPMLAAHMFVFYFGIVADITPPVALAAYAGSAIAKSNPLKTGVIATKLAIAAFIVPYIFALNPAMLIIDTHPLQIVQIAVTSLFGIFGIAAGLEGYVLRHAGWIERIVLLAAGLMLIIPETVTDIIGVVLIVGVILFQKFLKKNKKEATPIEVVTTDSKTEE
ncbi:MAG: TRAP transporter fused permease subunit [Clostridia bacterium]|nr:TRAP transporter fused permease subunit [Clostridia bacterium]